MDDERKGTRANGAYEQLRWGIIGAEILPGARLQTRALCDRFAVGLSPLREALNRLASEGLVIQRDHRGFVVAPLSTEDLDGLTKSRCWLNEIGLRESITHGGLEWEESVLLTFHRMSRTPRHADGTSGRNPVWEEAHRRFHHSLIAACGSTWLIGFCEQLFDAAERYRHVARISGAARTQNEEEHQAIMEATVQRKADIAVDLLNEHFNRTARLVRSVLANSLGEVGGF